jgi:crotonobetainyl-CoA:carnitine CoA-transferase CaiB-like acyl-CoA transferase
LFVRRPVKMAAAREGPGEPPLAGLLVLEFGHLIAVPSAGQALADLGARVVKVEPPTGDRSRGIGTSGRGSLRAWNSSKESIALDLSDEAERGIALRLAHRANIILDGYRNGVLASFGIDYEQLRVANPTLIYASLAGFRPGSVRESEPAVDAIIQAESGLMSVTGYEEEPLRIGVQIIDMLSGVMLSQAVLAALYKQRETGRGARVDLSLYDVALYAQGHWLTTYSLSHRVPKRSGNATTYGYPTDLFTTADGHLMVAAYFDPHWRSLCEGIGVPELAYDQRFATNDSRCARLHDLRDILNQQFALDTTDNWYDRLTARGLMVGRVRDYEQVFAAADDDGQSSFVWMDGEDGTRYASVALPYIVDAWKPPTRVPVPDCDADRSSILAELDGG